MEERFINKFTKEVIAESVQRYCAKNTDITMMGNHQNYVFRAYIHDRTIFIRITHESHRTKQLIQAEIEWIEYLSNNGILVANPVTSRNDLLIETVIAENDTFFVVAFEEAIGKGIGQYPWSTDNVELLGRLTAKMHILSQDYTPVSNCRRFEWYENNFISRAGEYLPKGHSKVIEALNELIEQINRLPRSMDSYGLIHGDMVACNYHVDGDRITIFDFDESSYCWFINDIAIQLFYESLTWRGELDIEGSRLSATHFLKGYCENKALDSFWLKQIPLFVKLREIILYIAIVRSRDLNDLDEWSMNFMKGRKERIENRIPFIEIDYSKLL
ncbi:phosphotransferase [Clostridium sp. YIM B02515]|uniref:Phosphotransferase n=1 Tax=Clostridium rhizosphaerae TaxID=2803861 RepID=A0ABS1TEF0_9CLOT|nr:phosphotransferase [Clostridium rhizosphaerae]MBL4937616.1 phosphotransferase [Clostridium rhizosphaerae]